MLNCVGVCTGITLFTLSGFRSTPTVSLWLFVGIQGDGHEGPDHGERAAEGPEDVQEDVLLHHAG